MLILEFLNILLAVNDSSFYWIFITVDLRLDLRLLLLHWDSVIWRDNKFDVEGFRDNYPVYTTRTEGRQLVYLGFTNVKDLWRGFCCDIVLWDWEILKVKFGVCLPGHYWWMFVSDLAFYLLVSKPSSFEFPSGFFDIKLFLNIWFINIKIAILLFCLSAIISTTSFWKKLKVS